MMKIKITDFGPIKEFEFDFQKSLVGIFGKNNAGKSYSISVVYLIVKNILEAQEDMLEFNFERFLENEIISFEEDMENKHLFQKKDVNIKKQLEFFYKDFYSKLLAERLTNSFFSTFDSLENLINNFSTNLPQIKLDTNSLNITFKVNKNITLSKLVMTDNIITRKINTYQDYKIEENQTIIYHSSESVHTFRNNLKNYTLEFVYSLFNEVQNNVDLIYYLPASRSGLYQTLSGFSQIFTDLTKKRGLFNKKYEIPKIPEPLSDYFLHISEINENSKELLKKDHFRELNKVVNEVEKAILKGKVFFKKENNKIYYMPDDFDFELDISLTSSMVSEISPIVSYLKYIIPYDINKRNIFRNQYQNTILILIEEPEAHLHPKVQIQLMDIFAKLSKIGIKIVITSHSNYMFNKLNNLVLAKKLNPEDIEVMVFDENQTGGKVTISQVDELGIDDNNFIDAAEQLYEEKMSLIDKLNGEE